jgi:hypothetical protein
MNISSPPLQRAQQLFQHGLATDDIIDGLRQEFALDPATAIAAVATIVLVAAQTATAIEASIVRPYLTEAHHH